MPSSSPTHRPCPEDYRGRFAPSPTGPLHAGSLAAALASWLDARAHRGVWLVRIEDLDPPREVPGAAQDILETLAAFGMESDEKVAYQSRRGTLYEAAFARLVNSGHVYGCACSRSEIELAHAAAGTPGSVYPGTCRSGTRGRPVRAWRFRVPAEPVQFEDRIAGLQGQCLEDEVGDFVARRADGFWAYQLAVVVDDAEQRITDIVRGADLLDNTPRQIALQRALGLVTPRYMHVGIVVNERGEKLSKQTGARALDRRDVPRELERAARHLGLPHIGAGSAAAFLHSATEAWAERRLGDATIAR
ncbi:MAG TPA: tRNA glutamyl-Q(34) synthetase GluQRS [Burkholderiaceae bacterium]|nr:tRNA glutamyl-Q(34) synthetase GluQRS [Burkholderiaceae bacterium]HQR70602.1 tRNA glutamyl-Q(34) synthetase GluQRS [Burkholderiaceae bacterium]